jgi:hypothetical protein
MDRRCGGLTADAAEKANRPGSAAANRCAARGSSMGEPSTDGRPAGVSLSLDLTSPVVPEGSAGDAALSARSPVARARCRHDAVTLPRTGPRHRSGAVKTVTPASQLGWLAGAPAHPPRSCSRRTGCHPEVARWVIRPCTDAADVDLAEAWDRTVFRRQPPEGDPTRLGSPVPVGAALSGTEDTLQDPITPGQGVFSNSQGSPQSFLVTHRNRGFIHRSCTDVTTGAHRTHCETSSARTSRTR